MDLHSTLHQHPFSESQESLLPQSSPSRQPTNKMNNLSRVSRSSVLPLLLIFNLGIFLTSIALLIYSAVYVRKPGPHNYYSHFSCLYLSACLAFQTLQIGRLTNGQIHQTKPWGPRFVYAYLVVVSLSGLIDGIAFCFTPKPDTTAVTFLACIDGLVGIVHRRLLMERAAPIISQHGNGTNTEERDVPVVQKNFSTMDSSSQTITGTERLVDMQVSETFNIARIRQSRIRKCSHGFLRVGNRFLMVLHCLLVLISTAGAIELALLYRYTNPGTIVPVTLASGLVRNINYNCTSVRTSNSSQPTIWLEADIAHGIVDFLGLQTALAIDHGRNSCSYDPPNFGWSDRLPSDLEDFFGYFNPLLKAIGKENEEIVLVGWGDGAINALMHTIENSKTTKALVILDASPDGIQWMDAQRMNNWTEAQMLADRSSDLSSGIFLYETILGLAIPWGLMPIFVPKNSTGYFDQSLYPRFRAQGLKEDFWAAQYYSVVQTASAPINTYLVNTTAPEGIEVYSIMTYNAGNPTTNLASDEFYRETKLDMVNHIAGGNLTAPVVWCNNSDCSLSFPVNQPGWTADALMSLGI